MIFLIKMNDERFVLNPDLIEFIEENPVTTISLVTGNKLLVKDKIEEVVEKIIEFRKKCHSEKDKINILEK